jgi:hypothetical protein
MTTQPLEKVVIDWFPKLLPTGFALWLTTDSPGVFEFNDISITVLLQVISESRRL